jgi:predicted TIM-barrel fold metal-dependent hydrolase
MTATRIDMHAHFYGGGLAEMLRTRRSWPCLRTRADGVEVMLAMHGEFAFTPAYHDHRVGLAQMAATGITQRILTFPGALGADLLPAAEVATTISAFNDHLAALRHEMRGTLTGLAGLPLADLGRAAAELRRIRRELRLPGIILPSNYFNSATEADLLRPILHAANEEGCLVMLHPGLKVGEKPPQLPPDFPQYRTSAVALQAQISQTVLTMVLTDVLDAFPCIRFQIVNLGGTIPFVVERIESIARHRNADRPFPTDRLRRIWYDCASLGPLALEAAVRVYGADRIVLGSDYPIFQDDPWETAVQPARISAEERDMIGEGTAAAILAER